MTPLLQVDGMTKAFGGLVAVSDVSLAVAPGEVLGLIGPNGSGKTTLLNLIAGAIRPDAGRIRMDGEDVTRLPNHLRVRKRINRTFQLVRMPPNMPAIVGVMAGVMYGGAFAGKADTGFPQKMRPTEEGGAQFRFDPFGMRKRYKDAEYEAAGILGELNLLLKAGHRLDQLTYIEQKRVELARALATRPRVLLLDEWLSGLSPRRARRRHVGGLEPGRAGHRGDPGRARDDGGARALRPRGGDECRPQDRRRAAR